jgi:hypothetical protein
MYIGALHEKNPDIMSIKPDDVIPFIKFIDQYPAVNLSIDSLENEIMILFKKYEIVYDENMKDICIKYRLRYMYVDIHNQGLRD